MICEVIGVLLSVGIPAVFISTSSDGTCDNSLSNQTNVTISNNLKDVNINSELVRFFFNFKIISIKNSKREKHIYYLEV
jgi:hypothetical protein